MGGGEEVLKKNLIGLLPFSVAFIIINLFHLLPPYPPPPPVSEPTAPYVYKSTLAVTNNLKLVTSNVLKQGAITTGTEHDTANRPIKKEQV